MRNSSERARKLRVSQIIRIENNIVGTEHLSYISIPTGGLNSVWKKLFRERRLVRVCFGFALPGVSPLGTLPRFVGLLISSLNTPKTNQQQQFGSGLRWQQNKKDQMTRKRRFLLMCRWPAKNRAHSYFVFAAFILTSSHRVFRKHQKKTTPIRNLIEKDNKYLVNNPIKRWQNWPEYELARISSVRTEKRLLYITNTLPRHLSHLSEDDLRCDKESTISGREKKKQKRYFWYSELWKNCAALEDFADRKMWRWKGPHPIDNAQKLR